MRYLIVHSKGVKIALVIVVGVFIMITLSETSSALISIIPLFETSPKVIECNVQNLCIEWGIAMLVFLTFYIVGYIGGFFVEFSAALVDKVLVKNFQVMSDPIITIGFRQSLQAANLGFVLAIIIIAFATIFRNESYGLKKMLWKLVVAATLVNFSLLLAGVLLDFSHVAARHFIGNKSLGSVLVTELSPQSFIISPGDVQEEDSTAFIVSSIFSGGFMNLVMYSAFLSLALWIIAIVILAVGIMLLVRYVYVVILLILMPIAWLLWVTPRFTEKFSDWWEKFFTQVFYLPAVTFFLSLGLKTFGRVSKV